MTDDETTLNRLFESYRDACPAIEPDSLFMPRLWQKIEARQSFGPVFERLTRLFASAAAAVCLLLLVLNLISSPQNRLTASSYTDALMAEHSAEQTYYTEAIWTPQSGPQPVEAIQH
jgi:hypothetical protein